MTGTACVPGRVADGPMLRARFMLLFEDASARQGRSRKGEREMSMLKTAALTLAFLAGVSAPAAAQSRMGNMHRDRDAGAWGAQCPALDLTPDQQSRVSALRDAAASKSAPLRAQLQTKMAEMKKLWARDNPDRQAIFAKQGEMESIHRQLRTIWTDFGLQVHAILTPEQRGKWAECAKGMMGMMGMGPGMGMGRYRGGPDGGPGMGGECTCPMCPSDQP